MKLKLENNMSGKPNHVNCIFPGITGHTEMYVCAKNAKEISSGEIEGLQYKVFQTEWFDEEHLIYLIEKAPKPIARRYWGGKNDHENWLRSSVGRLIKPLKLEANRIV